VSGAGIRGDRCPGRRQPLDPPPSPGLPGPPPGAVPPAFAARGAATAWTVARWTRRDTVTLRVEGHGRRTLLGGNAADPAGLVGWLGTLYPVRIDLRQIVDLGGPGAADGARRAAEDALRSTPGSGLGYGLLRYLSPDDDLRRRLAEADRADVLVNFLGAADALVPRSGPFRFRDPLELVRGAGVRRPFALEVDGWIQDGRLEVRLTFDPERLSTADIAYQGARFETHLGRVTSVDSQAAPAAADFPLANLDADKMKKLAAVLGRKKP
ncbi:MAG: hypothetical protein AAGN66_26485, partial [Acidobacteriota bacterium]